MGLGRGLGRSLAHRRGHLLWQQQQQQGEQQQGRQQERQQGRQLAPRRQLVPQWRLTEATSLRSSRRGSSWRWERAGRASDHAVLAEV